MVRASDCIRSSAIGRLITHLPGAVVRLSDAIVRMSGGSTIVRLCSWLCATLKRVAHGSAVLGWTDRVWTDHIWTDHAATRKVLQRAPQRIPQIKSVAQWLAAMVPALVLLTGDQERAAVVLIALIATAWAAGRLTKADTALEGKAFGKAYGRWLALLLLGSAFSVVFGSGDIQLAVWYEWIFWWMAAWLAYQSGGFITRTHRFGTVLAGLGIGFGILAVLQKTAGYGDVAGWVPLAVRPIVGARATGFFGNPNVFAAAVNLVMWPLAGFVAHQATKRDAKQVVRTVIYAIALAGLMLALVLTRSRAAWLGALGAAAIMIPQTPFFHKNKTRPGFWVATGALVLLIITILIPIPHGAERSSLELIQNPNAAWQGRLTIWKEAIQLFLHSPLSGGGPGSLSNIALPGGAQAFHAHNMLLQWLAETGLLLTLITILFIGWYYAQTRAHARARSYPRSLLLSGFSAAITATLIHGIFDYPWAARPIGLLWWAWIGFGLSLVAADKETWQQ